MGPGGISSPVKKVGIIGIDGRNGWVALQEQFNPTVGSEFLVIGANSLEFGVGIATTDWVGRRLTLLAGQLLDREDAGSKMDGDHDRH
jgi:hypothetical protein